MNINFIDGNKTPEERQERQNLIDGLLPKQTLIASILEPSIEKKLFGIIAKMIKTELEIYRQYPKRTMPDAEVKKEMVKDFDPRHPKTCFMGKAFKSNYNATDVELAKYRKAIGTIPHPLWGDCTLLEIWGGDHMKDYGKMVIAAFKYGAGIIDTCPPIKVHVNPLFQNSKSGEFQTTDEEKEEAEYHEMLLAKALFYGVKEPKKRRR